MTRIIAIDWSGDAKHAADKIWAAVVEDGELTELRNGRNSTEIVAFLEKQAAVDHDLVVGFDFAFSFPAWFLQEHGAIQDLWQAVDQPTFIDWRKEVAPFFGTTNSVYAGKGNPLRMTDRAMTAKSVFKVSGAGSVGTGSIRGMPVLASLGAAGFSIWPFMPPNYPVALEIYPRACLDSNLTRQIYKRFSKTNSTHRRQYLSHHLEGVWLDLASSSEDSFDAASSALTMWKQLDDLRSLPVIENEILRTEGIIWSPNWRALHHEWLAP